LSEPPGDEAKAMDKTMSCERANGHRSKSSGETTPGGIRSK